MQSFPGQSLPRETGLESLRQALSTCLRWPGGLCHLQGSCLGGREAVSMPFESASQTAKLRETSASGRAPGAGPGVRIQVQAVHWGGGPGRHCGLWGVRLGTCPHGCPGLRPHGNPEGDGAPCISMTPKGRGTWLRAAEWPLVHSSSGNSSLLLWAGRAGPASIEYWQKYKNQAAHTTMEKHETEPLEAEVVIDSVQ